MRTEPYTPCCRHVASTPGGIRRSLPEAQDRAVLPGGGGGVPCAWEVRSSRALSVRTGGGSAVQRKRRTVVGSCLRRRCSGRRRMPRKGSCGGPSRTGGSWDARRRRTQGRRLEMAGRLTGVSGGLKEREREQIATRLGVATMTVLSGAHRWGRSWQSRGAASRCWGRWPAARRGGPHGCRWCGQRSVGAAAPAAGGALGAGRQELAGGRERSEAREQGAAGSHRGRAPPATKAPVRTVSGSATVGS